MKTVILHFTHKCEKEEYQEAEGMAKVFEYLRAGFPIRGSFYDKDSDTLCINFGSKGAILIKE